MAGVSLPEIAPAVSTIVPISQAPTASFPSGNDRTTAKLASPSTEERTFHLTNVPRSVQGRPLSLQ